VIDIIVEGLRLKLLLHQQLPPDSHNAACDRVRKFTCQCLQPEINSTNQHILNQPQNMGWSGTKKM